MAAAPDDPFKLTPTRIGIIVMVLLALLTIGGAIFGSLTGYEQVREAVKATPTGSSQ